MGESMGSQQAVNLLLAQMDEAWQILSDRVAGLTEEEFFWEPVPGCWTAHPDTSGRWVLDYAFPDPDPAPFTTIAWRLIHIATCKVMYHEYAFGPAQLTWDTLEIPSTVGATLAMLEGRQQRLRDSLKALADADLDVPRATNWGEQWPTWRIFWTMIHHDAHHGAEIGCLRDLYRSQGWAGRPVNRANQSQTSPADGG
jgi:hypothetical protein